MAKYFNRGSGSIAIALRSGKSAALPGKSWLTVPAEEEGSEELILALKRGFLYRFDDSDPVPVVAPIVEIAPEVSVEKTTESVKVESVEEVVAPVSVPETETDKSEDDRTVAKFQRERSKKG